MLLTLFNQAGAGVAPPSAPLNLAATGGTLSVALTWTAVVGATSYNVYRGLASGGEALLATGVGVNSYVDSGLSAGVVYFYKVTAVNGAGESPQSNEASATPSAVGGGAGGGGMPGWGGPVGTVFYDPVPLWARRLYGEAQAGEHLVIPAELENGKPAKPKRRRRKIEPLPQTSAIVKQWIAWGIVDAKMIQERRKRMRRIKREDEMLLCGELL